MPYRNLPEPDESMLAEYRQLEEQAKRLRRRKRLHPHDPEILDDEEERELEKIEERLRNP